MQNLLLICGGPSGEHSISIASAKNIMANIDKTKFNVHTIGITRTGKWNYYKDIFYKNDTDNIASYELKDSEKTVLIDFSRKPSLFVKENDKLKPLDIDVVFPIVHGTDGEDGHLQGILELLNLPYVGTNTLSSAIGMEKDITKLIARYRGIPTKNWELITKPISNTSLKFPLFVKPTSSGSSLGISKVNDIGELKQATQLALKYSKSAIIEEAVLNPIELELAVLGTYKDPENIIISKAGQIQTTDNFYDFEEKYSQSSSANLLIPAKISDTILQKLQKYALDIFIATKSTGMTRVDFLLSTDNKIFFNELNTHPGFTQISMYPSLLENSGIEYKSLINKLIDLAFLEQKNKNS